MRYTAEAMSECPVAVGDILAQKYRVEQILGVGGMGVVVAARHVELGQLFAMKFLLPKLARNREAAERFRREARAAVKITGENVARVVDIGTMQGGIPFMVMEYLEGHDLATELEQHGPLDIPVAVDYVLQACLAIAEAHTHGLIHRDLKPANLFLTERVDHSRLIKVLDFGISKSMAESGEIDFSLTRATALVGSPLYMSPEQLENASDVDQRADVWSLGVILFELLTGCMPFNGESMPQLVCAVLNNTCPRVRQLRPAVPEALEAALRRSMVQDRARRFANVAELAEALAPFAKEGPRHTRRIQRVLRLPTLPSSPEQLKPSPSAPGWARVGALTVPGEAADEPTGAAAPHQRSAHVSSAALGSRRPATINSWAETANHTPKRRSKAVVWGMLSTLLLSGAAGAVWASLGGLELLPLPKRSPGSSAAASSEPQRASIENRGTAGPAPAKPAGPDLEGAPAAVSTTDEPPLSAATSQPRAGARAVPAAPSRAGREAPSRSPRRPPTRAANPRRSPPAAGESVSAQSALAASVGTASDSAKRTPKVSPEPTVEGRPVEPVSNRAPTPATTAFTDFGGRR